LVTRGYEIHFWADEPKRVSGIKKGKTITAVGTLRGEAACTSCFLLLEKQ